LITNPVLDTGHHKKIATHFNDKITDALLTLENLSEEAQIIVVGDSKNFLLLAQNRGIGQHVQLSLLLQAVPQHAAEILEALKPDSTSDFFSQFYDSLPFRDRYFKDVYLELSRNPNLCPEAIKVLIAFEQVDDHSEIMLNLASNPALPQRWQVQFMSRDNKELKARLVNNPALSPQVLASLFEQGFESSEPASVSGTVFGSGIFGMMGAAADAVANSASKVTGTATSRPTTLGDMLKANNEAIEAAFKVKATGSIFSSFFDKK
jgi:hypothetical protein